MWETLLTYRIDFNHIFLNKKTTKYLKKI